MRAGQVHQWLSILSPWTLAHPVCCCIAGSGYCKHTTTHQHASLNIFFTNSDGKNLKKLANSDGVKSPKTYRMSKGIGEDRNETLLELHQPPPPHGCTKSAFGLFKKECTLKGLGFGFPALFALKWRQSTASFVSQPTKGHEFQFNLSKICKFSTYDSNDRQPEKKNLWLNDDTHTQTEPQTLNPNPAIRQAHHSKIVLAIIQDSILEG